MNVTHCGSCVLCLSSCAVQCMTRSCSRATCSLIEMSAGQQCCSSSGINLQPHLLHEKAVHARGARVYSIAVQFAFHVIAKQPALRQTLRQQKVVWELNAERLSDNYIGQLGQSCGSMLGWLSKLRLTMGKQTWTCGCAAFSAC